jgi:hypothetical protein
MNPRVKKSTKNLNGIEEVEEEEGEDNEESATPEASQLTAKVDNKDTLNTPEPDNVTCYEARHIKK